MTTPLNSAAVGALVRETRVAAGLTQTQLAERIGASRFWVAAFERGKPSAELGLALKAIHALGLAITIAPQQTREHQLKADTSLASVVALARQGQSEADKRSLLGSLGAVIAAIPARGTES